RGGVGAGGPSWRKGRARRGRPPVAGRLIEHAEASDRLGKGGGVSVLHDFKRVEAGADEKQELVAQHVAGGAQLATEAVLFAQLPRLTVRAAVLEGREHQRHQRKAIEMRHKLRYPAVVRPQTALQ